MTSKELHRACARMFMVGFPGTTPDAAFRELMAAGLFGAILFKRNVTDAAGTAELCREVKSLAGRPFVLSVDQEGGRVARLRGAPFTALPPMRTLGQRGDEALVERAGRLLAYELRALGFDWDFAPVLDVDTNPANPVKLLVRNRLKQVIRTAMRSGNITITGAPRLLTPRIEKMAAKLANISKINRDVHVPTYNKLILEEALALKSERPLAA
jgi:hypothetical protein